MAQQRYVLATESEENQLVEAAFSIDNRRPAQGLSFAMMTHEPNGHVNAAGGGYGPPGGAPPPGGYGGPSSRRTARRVRWPSSRRTARRVRCSPWCAAPRSATWRRVRRPPRWGSCWRTTSWWRVRRSPWWGTRPLALPVEDRQKNSTLAVVSLVTGILAIIPCCNLYIMWLVAIITGVLAKKEIKEKPGLKGDGMALAGIVLGGVSLVIIIVVTILNFVFGGFAQML